MLWTGELHAMRNTTRNVRTHLNKSMCKNNYRLFVNGYKVIYVISSYPLSFKAHGAIPSLPYTSFLIHQSSSNLFCPADSSRRRLHESRRVEQSRSRPEETCTACQLWLHKEVSIAFSDWSEIWILNSQTLPAPMKVIVAKRMC